MTEKRKPTFDLGTIQSEFCDPRSLRLTRSAQRGAFEVGLETLEAIVALIQTITREHFYKSMTSYVDHRIWQDVYHVPFEGIALYVKFTVDDDGHLLISLKRKD